MATVSLSGPLTRVEVVTLRLAHLTSEQSELRAAGSLSELPAASDLLVERGVSTEERDFFTFCKAAKKRKNLAAVAERADELLDRFPNSMWAHFFRAVGSKQIAGEEDLVEPALAHAVAVDPNFLTGWQGLYSHLLSQGGLFSPSIHDQMCLVLRALLRLEPALPKWLDLIGHLWDYVTHNQFENCRILGLLGPYLSCPCPQRRRTTALIFVNYVRLLKKSLPMFSHEMLLAFQELILDNNSQSYRLGLLRAAIRFFDGHDLQQINALLKFVHTNKVFTWSQLSAREFACSLLLELFRVFGPDGLDTVLILKRACDANPLNNTHSKLGAVLQELTSSHIHLLDKHHQVGRLCWGRLLQLKVLADLKLYQEVYEQVLIDLNCGLSCPVVEKEYAKILIDILAHSADPALQWFTIRLCYGYLAKYGLDVSILHFVAFISIVLEDRPTAQHALLTLLSFGAIDDVIYLNTLLQQHTTDKLSVLETIRDLPLARLLSAKIHMDGNNTKQATTEMLYASRHFHAGITPFEYLGIHYYQRELATKSSRYFLEAFINYLVSCVSVNYIVALYSRHDATKVRTFFGNLNSRNAITMDVASNVNLLAGLDYLQRPKETLDFHRALEKFRKVTDFYFERRYIELVADALSYYGMHGSASDLYLMCHAEQDTLHVYPSAQHGSEMKVVKRLGYRHLSTLRRLAAQASKSPFALFSYACSVFDRALASYSVNNFLHCVFLCQVSIFLLCRCVAIYGNVASFWVVLGNVLFTVSSVNSSYGTVFVPSWLFRRSGQGEVMSGVSQKETFVLALRCYSIALALPSSCEIRRLTLFYVAVAFRYCKIFYKELGDRSLLWALTYALDSVDLQTWQRNNLCGVVLTGLSQFEDALQFFKDAMTVGSLEDARDAEFNLGIVYLRLGQFIDAHEVFMYRRGSDPFDSLVWRSYILLHHCLGDEETVLHYLWFLIYTIKHVPSLEQGVDYLRLICNSANPNSSTELKKKCLLYAINRRPTFAKLSFVGDCEVPHKLNYVTALNYFHHGEFHSHLGHASAAEENFTQFLLHAAQEGSMDRRPVDSALFNLAMRESSDIGVRATLDVIQSPTSASNMAKFLANSGPLPSHQSSDSDDVFTAFFQTFSTTDPSTMEPITRKLFSQFCSQTLLHRLLSSPHPQQGYNLPPTNKNTLSAIVASLPTLFNLDVTSTSFLNKKCFISFLEEELRHFELQTGLEPTLLSPTD